jgi:hypothetical protein
MIVLSFRAPRPIWKRAWHEPSAQLRTSLLLPHPFIPPLSDPTRVRRVSPWPSWHRCCDPSTWMDPSLRFPKATLMTSHESERRATRRVANGMRARPRSIPPPPNLSMLERCRGGPEALGPEPFPHSPPMGKSHATPLVVDVSRVVAIAGEAAGALHPGQKPTTLRSLANTSAAGALPPSELRNEQSADRPMPVRRRTYALVWFPSTPWTGPKGPIRIFRLGIGDFSPIWRLLLIRPLR